MKSTCQKGKKPFTSEAAKTTMKLICQKCKKPFTSETARTWCSDPCRVQLHRERMRENRRKFRESPEGRAKIAAYRKSPARAEKIRRYNRDYKRRQRAKNRTEQTQEN